MPPGCLACACGDASAQSAVLMPSRRCFTLGFDLHVFIRDVASGHA